MLAAFLIVLNTGLNTPFKKLIKKKTMSKKELIAEYYKTNNVVHWSDNKYSKEYVTWLERKVLKAIKKEKNHE